MAWGEEKPLAYLVQGHLEYAAAVDSLSRFHKKEEKELDVDVSRYKHGWARWVQSERRLREQGIMRQIHFQELRVAGCFR